MEGINVEAVLVCPGLCSTVEIDAEVDFIAGVSGAVKLEISCQYRPMEGHRDVDRQFTLPGNNIFEHSDIFLPSFLTSTLAILQIIALIS